MSSYNNLIALIIASVLVLCVSVSAAQLVRSSPANADRVFDFTVSPARDRASWHAFGSEWIVRLELSEITEDNTDYFHGTLESDVNAIVSFALLPGTGLSGMITIQGTTWWISAQPLPENGYSVDEDKLGIFMTREVHSSLDSAVLPSFSEPLQIEEDLSSSETALADDSEIASSESDVDAAASRKRTISTYKVAVFYDQKWATASNNPWSSQADTLALFNDVNAIYKASGLGQFTVSYQKQVTNSLTTLNDMLSYFSNTASTTLSSFKDSTITNNIWLVGSNVGGLAYVGTSCKGASQNSNRKTAVAGLVNYSRLWTVKTIAHELGHNRGANHQFDNACTSTLKTGCQCSVMSYCFPSASNNPRGAVNFFSDFSINEMKAAGCY
jgi:hypothetical protein